MLGAVKVNNGQAFENAQDAVKTFVDNEAWLNLPSGSRSPFDANQVNNASDAIASDMGSSFSTERDASARMMAQMLGWRASGEELPLRTTTGEPAVGWSRWSHLRQNTLEKQTGALMDLGSEGGNRPGNQPSFQTAIGKYPSPPASGTAQPDNIHNPAPPRTAPSAIAFSGQSSSAPTLPGYVGAQQTAFDAVHKQFPSHPSPAFTSTGEQQRWFDDADDEMS